MIDYFWPYYQPCHQFFSMSTFITFNLIACICDWTISVCNLSPKMELVSNIKIRWFQTNLMISNSMLWNSIQYIWCFHWNEKSGGYQKTHFHYLKIGVFTRGLNSYFDQLSVERRTKAPKSQTIFVCFAKCLDFKNDLAYFYNICPRS